MFLRYSRVWYPPPVWESLSGVCGLPVVLVKGLRRRRWRNGSGCAVGRRSSRENRTARFRPPCGSQHFAHSPGEDAIFDGPPPCLNPYTHNRTCGSESAKFSARMPLPPLWDLKNRRILASLKKEEILYLYWNDLPILLRWFVSVAAPLAVA